MIKLLYVFLIAADEGIEPPSTAWQANWILLLIFIYWKRYYVILTIRRISHYITCWGIRIRTWDEGTKILSVTATPCLNSLVASVGLEPTTPTLSDYGEIRTLCYLYHNQTRLSGLFCRSVVLYQLSYETYNISI